MKKWLIGLLILVAIVIVGAIGFFLAQANPPIEKTQTVTLTIQASPSFTLAVTPTTILTFPNRTIAYNATVTGVNNFAGDVVFSVTGLPAGVVATFLPSNTVTLGTTPKGVQINLAIPAVETLVGTYTLTIKALSTVYN